MSQLFTSGVQSFVASASVLPVNIPGWFPLGFTDLFSLQSKGLSRIFSSTTVRKHQFFDAQPSLWIYCSHVNSQVPVRNVSPQELKAVVEIFTKLYLGTSLVV